MYHQNYFAYCLLTLVIFSYFRFSFPATIHVLGDSHAYFSFTNTDGNLSMYDGRYEEPKDFEYSQNGKVLKYKLHIHWMGPITMHRVGRDKLNILDLRNFGVKEGDIAIFSFGEIDVRCHIEKQRDINKRDLSEIIDKLATEYIEAIALNKKNYQNLICIIFAPVPPTGSGHNPDYPIYGSLTDRTNINKLLIDKLKSKSSQFNIQVLDATDLLSDEHGALDSNICDGIVHVRPIYNYKIKDKLGQMLIELSNTL